MPSKNGSGYFPDGSHAEQAKSSRLRGLLVKSMEMPADTKQTLKGVGAPKSLNDAWGRAGRAVPGPVLHELAAFLWQRGARVGSFSAALELMRECVFDDLAGEGRLFACPVPEGGTEPVERDARASV